jgi:hypothetical protein
MTWVVLNSSCIKGTGRPARRQVSPRQYLYGVSINTYRLARLKIFQFFNASFKANASNILYEESQKYVFHYKYNKIF